jgi:FkbM family methyltransferase
MPVMTVNSDIGPYDLVLLPHDHISEIIRGTRQPYEQSLIAIVRELTRPGSLILDIGANLGNHTIYWAKAGRRVVAFEPNPVTQSALVESVRLNKLDALVDLRPVAVGAAPGTGSLRTLLENNHGAIAVDAAAEGEISIVRLDDLDLPYAAAIKIDVEGAEESVLLGARKTIARARPFIISEMQEGSSDGAGNLLRDLGYRRIPASLAITPTFLYIPSLRSVPALLRSPTLTRQYTRAVARRAIELAAAICARVRRDARTRG